MIRLFSDPEGNYTLEALDLGRVELGRTTKYKMYIYAVFLKFCYTL